MPTVVSGSRRSRTPASPPRTEPRGSGCWSSQLSRNLPTRITRRLWSRLRMVTPAFPPSRNWPRISQRSTPSSGRASRSSVVISAGTATVDIVSPSRPHVLDQQLVDALRERRRVFDLRALGDHRLVEQQPGVALHAPLLP